MRENNILTISITKQTPFCLENSQKLFDKTTMISKPGPPFKMSISDEELNAMAYDKREAFVQAEMEKWQRNNPPSYPPSLASRTNSRIKIEVKPGTPTTLSVEVNDYR